MSFSQALSGLRAQAENIKVISNNIANSQTVGFKTGRVSFADVFANSQVGLGVGIAAVTQDFTSGDLENTGRNLDLAIAGSGFYRLEQSNGEVVYSRNGQFNRDADGYLVNSTGQYLTGYVMDENAEKTATQEAYPFSPVIAGGAPERLYIPPDDMPAKATSEASGIYNLDASVDFTDPNALQTADVILTPAVPAGPGGTPAAIAAVSQPVSFHYSSSFTVYDSLGNARTVTTYYRKTADNTWTADIALDGVRRTATGTPDYTLNFAADGSLAATAITTPGGVALAPTNPPYEGTLAEGQVMLTFPAAPPLVPGTPPGAGFNLGGAGELQFEFDLAGTTQFNNNSVQNTLSQNGYTSGTLIGVEVQEDGTVTRIYTNEERADAGQLVLANFLNPEGLMPDGDNAWRQSNASGEPILGVGGTGVFGGIVAGVLENSNVDLAQQLVDMIVSQRAYQANSSSIGTQDEMLQTVINL